MICVLPLLQDSAGHPLQSPDEHIHFVLLQKIQCLIRRYCMIVNETKYR